MTHPRQYHLRAVLTSGGRWRAEVRELPGVRPSDHRSLTQLEARTRAVIQAHDDVSDLELVTSVSTGDAQLDDQISHARDLRRQADELADQARAAAKPLAQRLTTAGVSVRDAGRLLGYSGAAISGMTKPHSAS